MLLPLACLRQACACLERRFSLDVTGSMSFGKTRPLSSMCHNSTLSVYGMSEHWALTFPKPTRQFKDIPSYNLALICSSNKSFRISCKGLSETPLHFIFRYKGDSVGRYRRYGLQIGGGRTSLRSPNPSGSTRSNHSFGSRLAPSRTHRRSNQPPRRLFARGSTED